MKAIPFCFFFMMVCIHLFFINTLLAKISEPKTIFWSTDPVWGVFGFFDRSQALLAFVPYGIFASFFGSVGYTIAQFFFSPVVAASALLLEPPIAQLIAFAMHIDKFPGPLTIIGAISAIFGFYLL